MALGSKLDVINKHSFNNFRLRVGEGPPLLGKPGTSSSPSQALPPPSPLLGTPQLTPGPPPASSLGVELEAAGPGALGLSYPFPKPQHSRPILLSSKTSRLFTLSPGASSSPLSP